MGRTVAAHAMDADPGTVNLDRRFTQGNECEGRRDLLVSQPQLAVLVHDAVVANSESADSMSSFVRPAKW